MPSVLLASQVLALTLALLFGGIDTKLGGTMLLLSFAFMGARYGRIAYDRRSGRPHGEQGLMD